MNSTEAFKDNRRYDYLEPFALYIILFDLCEEGLVVNMKH